MRRPKRAPKQIDLVEVDETILDVFVVDEEGDPLLSGRPILAVMSDAATRRILGFKLERRPPEQGGR